jgi:uncharacterized protein (DUF433 family)
MVAVTKKNNRAATKLPKLVKEEIYGEMIEYYPLGEFVVIQPGVQGGLPTIKNTRITAGVLVGCIEQGRSPIDVAQAYGIPVEGSRRSIGTCFTLRL